MANVINVLFVRIFQKSEFRQNLEGPHKPYCDLVQYFSLKMGSSLPRMRVKAEKVAYHTKHGFWSTLNFVRILTVGNSDKNNIYNIGHW